MALRPQVLQRWSGPTIVFLFESVRTADELLWAACSRIVLDQAFFRAGQALRKFFNQTTLTGDRPNFKVNFSFSTKMG
jgi:hypothetical protein